MDYREAERQKYVRAYAHKTYAMSDTRLNYFTEDLKTVDNTGSFLDVSCGRGEAMTLAKINGFRYVQGTEIVPKLIKPPEVIESWSHKLPFDKNSFDVVALLDVIEHLIPPDDHETCLELKRIAIKHIFISTNNMASTSKAGDVLHVNRRPYKEWNYLFIKWFNPWKIRWLSENEGRFCETWRIDLAR